MDEKLKKEIESDIKDCFDSMSRNSDTIIQKAKIGNIHKCLADLDGISRMLTNSFEDLYELGMEVKYLLMFESSLQSNLTEAMNTIKKIKQEILGRCS